MKSISTIEIKLDSIEEGLILYIDAQTPNSLFDGEEDAVYNSEARFQLVEGYFYDYSFNLINFTLGNIGSNIVQSHSRNKNTGVIAPNIFVGTLSIPVVRIDNGDNVSVIKLEVQSIKSSYRDDYRDMLELITEKCTDLLLQANSPVSHHFEVDYTKDNQTLYQKFAFIKSIISSDEFVEAIHRIVVSPVTKWSEISENRDVRQMRKFSNTNVKEIIKGGNRTKIPEDHFIKRYGINSIPERISSIRKSDSVDTVENRFVKHALETFLKFCTDINNLAVKNTKVEKESEILISELELHLQHNIFKEISKPHSLNINSPVLQRKEGYREVLRVWLMFDLASKLIWSGGDDVYSAGKKDIATLYEYWLFFMLLDLFQNIFDINPKNISELIKVSDDGFSLQLKQGRFTALKGIYRSKSRNLNIIFSYNRSFTGNKKYPDPGSWSTSLRPDYTLTFWPVGISEIEAEKQEVIVHIHFDAKYKIANLNSALDQNLNEDLDGEKIENRKGIFKNADLLKMHTYKDAIRRTGGAYILYPGSTFLKKKGFHEIIPGLGAFPVNPSKVDSGIEELKSFILEVIEHFVNRSSQREKIAFRTYDIYKTLPNPQDIIREPLPESYFSNRDLIPDDTYVLIGYYNSQNQHDWIKKNKLYNFRIGTGPGSIILDTETVNSKYLLLHTKDDKFSGELWRIVGKGPKVFSKEDLINKGYLSPTQNNYLVFQLEPVIDPELKNCKWNFKMLKNYLSNRASAFPFTASLTELMKTKID